MGKRAFFEVFTSAKPEFYPQNGKFFAFNFKLFSEIKDENWGFSACILTRIRFQSIAAACTVYRSTSECFFFFAKPLLTFSGVWHTE